MPDGDNTAFVLDDKVSTTENLTTFASALEAKDAQLGAALAPYLRVLATGQTIAAATILDSLYAALMAYAEPVGKEDVL